MFLCPLSFYCVDRGEEESLINHVITKPFEKALDFVMTKMELEEKKNILISNIFHEFQHVIKKQYFYECDVFINKRKQPFFQDDLFDEDCKKKIKQLLNAQMIKNQYLLDKPLPLGFKILESFILNDIEKYCPKFTASRYPHIKTMKILLKEKAHHYVIFLYSPPFVMSKF
jgi:hypothetical protein